MTGDTFGGSSPSITCRSVLQTPHTLTRTKTSPSPGSGSGNSPYPSGLVSTLAGVRRKQAFIASPQPLFPPHTKRAANTRVAPIIPKSPGPRKGGIASGYQGFHVYRPVFRGTPRLPPAYRFLEPDPPQIHFSILHVTSLLAFRHLRL